MRASQRVPAPHSRRQHGFERAVTDNKRLDPILAMIRGEQMRRDPECRSRRRRRDQRDARLF
jgi:hypothetical protein